MKKSFILIVVLAFIGLLSCSDDQGGTVTDPFGTGGTGGTGGVTFTVSSTQGNQGGVIFTATPSVDVKITKVTLSLPAQQFNDVLQGDGTTVYPANQAVQLDEYTGVATGQQWTFQFEGNLASNNQAFNVTANYTIP